MIKKPTYVTGARGCIGSRLLQANPKLIPIEGDILTIDLQSKLTPGSTLLHLAAKSNIAESRTSPELYQRVNVDGLQRVADACLAKSVRLLFTSTVHVYGCPGPLIKETCPNLVAYSPYGATKIAGEKILEALGAQGLRYSIFRMPGVFGYSPSIHFDTTINKFFLEAKEKKPLRVWRSTWEATRPHLYIGDCVNAIQHFLDRDIFNNEIYNLITGNFTSKEIIEAIRAYIPDLTISFVDSPSMNPLLDIDDTKIRETGFKPTGTLEGGITEMARSMQ